MTMYLLIFAALCFAGTVSAQPENDTCDGALPLNAMPASFTVLLCGAANDYSPGAGGCTGYAADGPDLVYSAVLPADGRIAVCVEDLQGNADLSLYLVTDCGDVPGSCVAGEDDGNPECIDYTGGPGTYFLIVDSYDGCDQVQVTVGELVPARGASFGAIRNLY